MIHHSLRPLPPVKAEEIRVWLNQREVSEFLRVLAARSASATAAAGNLLMGRDEGTNEEDAKIKAEEAVFYRKMIEVINECRRSDSQLQSLEIEPQPFSATSTPET